VSASFIEPRELLHRKTLHCSGWQLAAVITCSGVEV
jgi:hypothetical protein